LRGEGIEKTPKVCETFGVSYPASGARGRAGGYGKPRYVCRRRGEGIEKTPKVCETFGVSYPASGARGRAGGYGKPRYVCRRRGEGTGVGFDGAAGLEYTTRASDGAVSGARRRISIFREMATCAS